ncbi:hypothetical protein AAHC03_0405 [Spirometra sp. Aus1]
MASSVEDLVYETGYQYRAIVDELARLGDEMQRTFLDRLAPTSLPVDTRTAFVLSGTIVHRLRVRTLLTRLLNASISRRFPWRPAVVVLCVALTASSLLFGSGGGGRHCGPQA